MNWKRFFGLTAGVIAMRVVGFIPSIWIAASFIVVIWFWSFLAGQFPARSRLINWSFAILLIVSISATIGWNLYVAYVEPYSGMSREALKRAKIARDLKTSLWLNPEMLKSRIGLANQLQLLQDAVGEKQEEELGKIRDGLKNGLISPKDAWEKTETILKEESEYRQKTIVAIDKVASILSVLKTATAPTVAQIAEISYCVGDYDYTNLDVIKTPQVKIPIEKDCWTKVVLPTEICFNGKPSVVMELRLTDGRSFIVTPTKRPHLGQLGEKRILIVRGQEIGEWTIDFEKKS
ncbi:hypothetical protein HZB04_01920 [Candidatus Wolfebacteria bacterium]|nr:hypothetical protein [Candidatus Wolfebacteria bacterium]